MVEIAKCNGVGKQYVSRLIRLAFLAPEMVERLRERLLRIQYSAIQLATLR
jgi:hypothetical protein